MMWARSCSLWHGIGSSFRSLPLPGAGSGNGLRRRIRRKSLSAEEQGRFLSSMTVFDRKVKREQRGRAAFLDAGGKYEYLRKHVGEVLVDRIEDIKRDFPLALDVGCHTGQLYELICREQGLGGEGGIGGVKRLVQCDISHRALQRAQQRQASLEAECSSRVETHFVQADEEFLPFPAETFDLVLSNLSLHWVNDLPSAMTQIRNVLKPDGVFIGSMLGGSTLTELRACLLLAEQEREGGMSVHTSPAAQVSDCGNLLSGAGFTIPTVDQDTLEIAYPDAMTLMEHLQDMGEGNASLSRRAHVSRETFIAAASLYQSRHGNEDGTVSATFQVVHMIGWAPHESQPKPKRRGSAQRSFVELHHSTGSGREV